MVSLGLVRLEEDASQSELLEQLRARLGKVSPNDQSLTVDVLTAMKLSMGTSTLAVANTDWFDLPVSVALSLLVGAAIVYMVLATDVTDRLPEYATLLAIGYSYRYLCAVVLTQAIALGLCGFALVGSIEVLYRVTESASGIPISMNPGRVIGVGLLGAIVCLVSGTLALRKLWKAEPASLF